MDAEAASKVAQIRAELGGRELTQENVQRMEMKKREEEEAKMEFLARICSSEALARLKRVALVKPEIAAQVQNALLRSGQQGQITSQIQEQQIMTMLEQAGQRQAAPKVTIIHRKTLDSDSEVDDSDLM